MRYLFLDIDGVLNSMPWLEEQDLLWKDDHEGTLRHEEGTLAWECQTINPEHVGHLNEIVRVTCAKVVISSAWRQRRTIAQLQAILEHVGFEGEVVGKTPRIKGERGNEILRWIETGVQQYGLEVDCFVILDDENDMGAALPFLVQTSMETGLTAFHAREVIERFKSQPLLLGKARG